MDKQDIPRIVALEQDVKFLNKTVRKLEEAVFKFDIKEEKLNPQPIDKEYIQETIQLRERIKELEKIPVFMVDYFDAYGSYPSDRVIREQFSIKY